LMYGKFALLDNAGKLETGRQIHIGDTNGKNEAWLRDTLFRYPEIIPTEDIDSTFGPLIPLCKELRTDAGPIDAVFINTSGRLTFVECKLWKNPQARREVVAQTLDYVSALTRWEYADLQRQVGIALGSQGNIPFELAQKQADGKLREQEFGDSVSRSLREGRVLVLIAGDGIREGIQSLTELVNRSSTKAFTFGLIEVALYEFSNGRFAIQPRVLAETETITRQVTVANMPNGTEAILVDSLGDEPELTGERVTRGNREHLRGWWQPIIDKIGFSDPEQEPPFWLPTNNLVLNTPFPGIQIKAYALTNGSRMGVFLSGPRRDNVLMLRKYLKRERATLLAELPKGTHIETGDCNVYISEDGPESDDERRAWIMEIVKAFVNVLRPRLKKWYSEARS
jgi:hypothetical protein